MRMSHGYISQADWLDETHILSLVVSPEEVEVWRTNIDTLERDRFISNSVMTSNICPLELSNRLEWSLSPQRTFLFFKWFDDQGRRDWALLDISEAPRFRLKHFAEPAGMQVARVLFSPDDRYAVFIDDSFIEGSSVSALVMDLEQGEEAWRISSQELGFISDEWWRADLGPSTFQIGASLHNGEFHNVTGIATASITDRSIEFEQPPTSLIVGCGASWGWANCRQEESDAESEYFLEIHETGGESSRTGLDLRPIGVLPLATAGNVLLINSADLVTNKLWLVRTNDPRMPELIDANCRDISLSPAGDLLVLSGNSNEIRIYSAE